MDVIAWAALVMSWLLLALTMKFVFILLRVLKQARRLAEMSRDAALQLARNLDEEAFDALERLGAQLPEAVAALPPRTARAGRRVSSVSPGIGGRPR